MKIKYICFFFFLLITNSIFSQDHRVVIDSLTQTSEKLDKVIVYAKKQTETIGRKNAGMPWYFRSDIQFGFLLIPKKKYIDSRIEKILLPIEKGRYTKSSPFDKKSSFNATFKIQFFSTKADLPHEPLLSRPIIISCNQDSEKTLEIKIPERIKFVEEGVFLCIEKLKNPNEEEKNPHDLPGLKFTKREIKGFDSKMYHNSKSSNIGWYLFPWNSTSMEERHLAIQLVVYLPLSD